VEYLRDIWVQPETPLLRQEAPYVPADAPDVMQEVPDDLQETPDNPQEEVNDLQGNSQVRQVDFKMTEYSRRDLSFDEEANTHLLEHFCTRGTSEKDPTKPGKTALFQLLLKYMVASGKLVIDRIEDGVPILSRGNAHAHAVAHVTAITQETDRTLGVTVPISAEPWADPLAAQARGGETCQDGVGEGDQDCAGEDAGSGAGGREVQARGHCRFQKDQESRTVQGFDGEAGEAPSMTKAVQGRGMQRDSLRGGGAWLFLLAH
jgi:hypothetical protein